MIAIKTYNHEVKRSIETCIAIFPMGKFGRKRDYACYRVRNDSWRLDYNDKVVNSVKKFLP